LRVIAGSKGGFPVAPEAIDGLGTRGKGDFFNKINALQAYFGLCLWPPRKHPVARGHKAVAVEKHCTNQLRDLWLLILSIYFILLQ